MTSYNELTFEEYLAITTQPGFDWHAFYWSGSPSWRRPIAFLKFHLDGTQRDIRRMVRKYGKFDPFWPVKIVEV